MTIPTTISISADGRYQGYLVDSGRDAPLLLVLQEIYGVNDEVRRVAEHYGSHGFTVLAPDLLWRVRPGLEFAYADREAARAAVAQLGTQDILDDIREAASTLARRSTLPAPAVGLLAFGWSGQYALLAAQGGGYGAVAAYYPGNIGSHVATARRVAAPLLFHFSGIDPRTPPEARAALRRELAERDDVEIFTHPSADHGFANHGRQEFHAEAAALTDGQTLSFLSRTVARTAP